MGLASLLFAHGPRHITAEDLHAEAARDGERMSLATVYNNLRAFTEAGLVSQVAVDGGSILFDTNADPHHHFYDEKTGALTDIPADAVRIAELPEAPPGAEIAGVDVIVRLRRSR
ncbi:MAG: transcriptional repressor [Caulobacterales bacterium]|nr:transcriptional repressor [Caulobacterales bacterium]